MDIRAKSALPLALALLIFLPAAASASLEASTPALYEPPRAPDSNLVLTFPVGIKLASSSIELIDAHSRRVPIDTPELSENGKDVNVPLRAPLQPGVYTVKWRAVSSDGRVNQGSYDFHVDP